MYEFLGLTKTFMNQILIMTTKKQKKDVKYVFIDPPSGHRYGFPKKVKETITEEEIIELLLQSNYPKDDIEFALKYLRWCE